MVVLILKGSPPCPPTHSYYPLASNEELKFIVEY
jgi:hypothetical protein